MTSEELSVEYDRFYEEAEELFKKFDPCKFKGNKCVHNGYKTLYKDGCCGTGCPFHTPKGCSIRCLGCKTFFCKGGSVPAPGGFLNSLHDLREEISRVLAPSALSCYTSKEEFLKRIYREEG